MAQRIISARQREILALIENQGTQFIEDLARRYDLTTQTIRRDINTLCDLGFARRFTAASTSPSRAVTYLSMRARS